MLFATTENFHRATLNFDRVFTQYCHLKTFNSGTKWTPIWSQPDNICVDICGTEAVGLVGLIAFANSMIIKGQIANAHEGIPYLMGTIRMEASTTNPATIRGTKGYVVVECFNSNPMTTKVDAYSYGVLLLEIISCRKSISDLEVSEEEKVILTYWACDCFQEGKLDNLVKNDMEAIND
ncbi:G-type lectin S-receptor-like serine/threonine-protein kinase RLK1 [Camellia lanceoleosa]|uniref:G-type lectin S-receptor-like serine/threonine-protein kinase RLK1 n=1 Tax=Camellia lanceoleosa TaxID=1840588 RepID=A0ACC0F6M3_9ERIC|nr:G-type lectin S-receptor-like serine/threonine-protein kinase RLK1 [Camellia lanceoleosa]